jgi:hypothetical protein
MQQPFVWEHLAQRAQNLPAVNPTWQASHRKKDTIHPYYKTQENLDTMWLLGVYDTVACKVWCSARHSSPSTPSMAGQ